MNVAWLEGRALVAPIAARSSIDRQIRGGNPLSRGNGIAALWRCGVHRCGAAPL